MAKAATREVQIPGFAVNQLSLKVRGTAPLLMNKYHGKDKIPADMPPEEAAELSVHRDADGNVVYPGVGFKRAAIAAARCFGKRITQTGISQNIQVLGGLIPIDYGQQRVFTSWVNQPPGKRGTPNICHRPSFWPWSAELNVTYNPSIFELQEVLNIFAAAGTVGIGGGRPGSPSGGIGMGTFALDLDGQEKQDNGD